MDVRMARPTDVPLILSLAYDDAAQVVHSIEWPPAKPAVRSLVTCAFPVTGTGRIWVARDTHGDAVLEAKPQRYVIGWDITRLAIRGEVPSALEALVTVVTEHVQNRGIPRLFARCREPGQHLLRNMDFAPLAREYVLLGPTNAQWPRTPISLEGRYRMPQDAWPLHQLESQVTPPLVRHLEGMTGLDWSNPVRGRREVVVEHEGRVVAWIGWGKKIICGQIEVSMLVHPDHAGLAPELLHYAHRQIGPGCRFRTRVRDYQDATLRAFDDAGFQIVSEDVLMVKHAALETVRVPRGRLHVAAIPSLQAFPIWAPSPPSDPRDYR